MLLKKVMRFLVLPTILVIALYFKAIINGTLNDLEIYLGLALEVLIMALFCPCLVADLIKLCKMDRMTRNN